MLNYVNMSHLGVFKSLQEFFHVFFFVLILNEAFSSDQEKDSIIRVRMG